MDKEKTQQAIQQHLQQMGRDDMVMICYDYLPKLYPKIPFDIQPEAIVMMVLGYVGQKRKRLKRLAKALGVAIVKKTNQSPTINQTATGKKVGQTVYGDINF